MGAGGMGAGDKLFGQRKETGNHARHAPFIGVNAVGLVERRVERHPFEDERIEQRIVALRQCGEYRFEVAHVIGPKVARRLHAGKQRRQSRRLDRGKDGIEVGACLGRFQPAQRVVGAERHDHRIRPGCASERPADTGLAARAGIARDTGIDDGNVMAARAQGGFEPGRKGL